MQALAADADWPLVFPCAGSGPPAAHPSDTLARDAGPAPAASIAACTRARCGTGFMQANYDCAEPGVIFIDRVQAQDNLGYCERIRAANPCGEVPLPPYGACDLARST